MRCWKAAEGRRGTEDMEAGGERRSLFDMTETDRFLNNLSILHAYKARIAWGWLHPAGSEKRHSTGILAGYESRTTVMLDGKALSNWKGILPSADDMATSELSVNPRWKMGGFKGGPGGTEDHERSEN